MSLPLRTLLTGLLCLAPTLALAQQAPTESPEPEVDLTTPATEPGPSRGPVKPKEEPAAPAPANDAGEHWYGFSFRLGGLFIAPLGSSQEVQLQNVAGPARLSLSDGPIAGSGVSLGTNFMFAATIGYALPFWDQRLGVETILALPFTMKLSAKGTLATQSLAPTALGNLPTGVPALGSDLGEATVLPPVFTATLHVFPRHVRVNPYVGFGASYLMTISARITNPILTAVTKPQMTIPAQWGWVAQAGVDVHLWRWFFLTADFKYIGGLDLTATVKDIYVKLPGLPIFDTVRVGDNVAKVSVNPITIQVGLGMNL